MQRNLFFSLFSLVFLLNPVYANDFDNNVPDAYNAQQHLTPGIGILNYENPRQFTDEFCQFVLDMAPEELIERLILLKDPNCPDRLKPRRMLLYGTSGSGKTTLAQVIGQELNVPVIYINAGLLGNEYKNSTAQNLRRAIEPCAFTPCVVIIDEIDCIVKQAKNEKDLDIDTPKQVWEIFDVCSHFPNMILIGITNDVTGMPAPLQTRFAGDTIEVPQLDSAAAHKQIILFHLKETLWSMSDNELDSLAKKTKKFSTREVEKLAITACSLAYLRNSIAHCVTYGDCQKAYAQIEKSRSLLKKWSWSDYEKPLQYGLQIAGLVVNIVSLISNWRMSYLSHTLAKEAHELAKISFAHNVEATKASQAMGEKQMAQLGDQFKESMALSKESFEHSKETAEISQLQVERGYQQAETLHADNKNFQRSLSVQSILVSNEQFKESMDLSKLSLLHGIESTQLQLKQSFYQHEENKALQLALALEGKQHSVDLQNISNGYAQRAQDRAGYEALSNFLNSRRELTPQERREQNLRNGTYGYK